MRPATYIVTNHRHGTLYTGVTSDLARRTWEHRTGALEGFSKRYGLKVLVWYEPHGTMEEAITREKHIKAWKRDWKIRLIERMNPTWRDLYEDLNR
jgi:putative endonuclease